METVDKKASIVEQHYDPYTTEILTVTDETPVDVQVEWFNAHKASVLIYRRRD